jgi:hypothetical protein
MSKKTFCIPICKHKKRRTAIVFGCFFSLFSKELFYKKNSQRKFYATPCAGIMDSIGLP